MVKKKRAHGEGSFQELPNGKIRYRWMYGYQDNGNPLILTVTGKSKTECLKLRKEREKKYPKNAGSTVLGNTTLLDLCKQHLAVNMKQKGRLKPTAADRREVTIRNQIEGYAIARKQAAGIRPSEIQDHIETLLNEGLSVSTVAKTYHVIDSAYKWAMLQDCLSLNPCDRVRDEILSRLKQLKARDANAEIVTVLSAQEQECLKKTALTKDDAGKYLYPVGPYILFLLATGIRVGEMCALRWSDVNGERLRIEKTRHYCVKREGEKRQYFVGEGTIKNEHARHIQLSEEALNILDIIREISEDTDSDSYIYRNRRGNPSNPSNMDYLINRLYREANLPPDISGAHVLRHTFATGLFDAGISIKRIAGYIGDEEATVSKYYIATRKQLRENGETFHYEPFPMIV